MKDLVPHEFANGSRAIYRPNNFCDSIQRMKTFTLKAKPCCSRRPYRPDDGLWFCANPRVGVGRDNLVTLAFCNVCRLRDVPVPADKLLPFSPPNIPKYSGPCQHLGEVIRLQVCATCRGNVELKIFSCNHPGHDTTTIKVCQACADYAPLVAINLARSETEDPHA